MRTLAAVLLIYGRCSACCRHQSCNKTRSRRTRLIAKFSVECLDYRPRDVEAKSVYIGVRLKRLEQAFGLTDTRSRVLKIHTDLVVVSHCGNRQLFLKRRFHCAEAVPGNIQEDLQQSISVRPNQWQILRDSPDH